MCLNFHTVLDLEMLHVFNTADKKREITALQLCSPGMGYELAIQSNVIQICAVQIHLETSTLICN